MNDKLLINCNEIIKEMKPLHGVCNGPLHKGNAIDESVFFRQLQPPFVRLHDVNWPYSREVDMHAVFPDFSKDPENPDSYDFTMTDKYLKAIKDVGSDIIYRLGESIAPGDYKRFVNPPTDMEKWARICIGIIRHYNDGWADGFRYNIRYWEIWNEPSVETMWTGTLEQYLEMYSAAAKAIRAYDPSLKICGPVACSADRITNEVFLKYINSHLDVPHDVYTFHLYGHSVENTRKYLSILNEAFEKYNKRDFDVFITEWNYAPQTEDGEGFWETLAATKDIMVKSKLFRKIGSLEAACYSAGFLTVLQDSIVTQANYFETASSSHFSCFDLYGIPNKVFYGLLAYKKVFDYKYQVSTVCDYENIYAIAGCCDNGCSFYIVNYMSDIEEVTATITLPNNMMKMNCRISKVDDDSNLEPVYETELHSDIPMTLTVKKNSILLVQSI